ncbi:MAG: flagellar assembly regulator FliX, partial [Alphaproteobacteria bacterium]|nr:flagellar assembly regulator FliX [Alphaproteobacteria bacterium]
GVSDPTHKQHGPAFRRAEDLLEHLEGIRDGILAGVIPRPQLEDLVHRLAERRPREHDPLLISLLDEIELRAKVELAKLSVI